MTTRRARDSLMVVRSAYKERFTEPFNVADVLLTHNPCANEPIRNTE